MSGMCSIVVVIFFFFSMYGDHRDLRVLTHAFPTRRSSDLRVGRPEAAVGEALGEVFGDGEAVPYRLAVDHQRRHLAGRAVLLDRSEEHTSELQSLMRISYAVFCLKKKKKNRQITKTYKDVKHCNSK